MQCTHLLLAVLACAAALTHARSLSKDKRVETRFFNDLWEDFKDLFGDDDDSNESQQKDHKTHHVVTHAGGSPTNPDDKGYDLKHVDDMTHKAPKDKKPPHHKSGHSPGDKEDEKLGPKGENDDTPKREQDEASPKGKPDVASEKGKPDEASGKGKGKPEEASGKGKGKPEEAGGKGKPEEAVGKGKQEEASGKGKPEEASGKGKQEEASGKGKPEEASEKVGDKKDQQDKPGTVDFLIRALEKLQRREFGDALGEKKDEFGAVEPTMGPAAQDEDNGTQDEDNGTKDEDNGTKDEDNGTKDEDNGTQDEDNGTQDEDDKTTETNVEDGAEEETTQIEDLIDEEEEEEGDMATPGPTEAPEVPEENPAAPSPRPFRPSGRPDFGPSGRPDFGPDFVSGRPDFGPSGPPDFGDHEGKLSETMGEKGEKLDAAGYVEEGFRKACVLYDTFMRQIRDSGADAEGKIREELPRPVRKMLDNMCDKLMEDAPESYKMMVGGEESLMDHEFQGKSGKFEKIGKIANMKGRQGKLKKIKEFKDNFDQQP